MKISIRQFIPLVAAILLLAGCSKEQTIMTPVKEEIQYPSGKERAPGVGTNPMQLWYKQSANKWEEALPLGNGRLGAMVYGGVSREHIQFNEETLWTGQPTNYAHEGAHLYLDSLRALLEAGQQEEAHALGMAEFMSAPMRQEAYQPFGDIFIDFDHTDTVKNYRRWLDLEQAATWVTYEMGDIRFTRQAFSSYPDNALVMLIKANKPGAISFVLTPDALHDDKTITKADDNTLRLNVRVKDGVLFGESQIRIIPYGGSIEISTGEGIVSGADSVMVLLTAATNYISYNEVTGNPRQKSLEQLEKAAAKSFSALLKDHIHDYYTMYHRLTIDLGHSALANEPTDVRLLEYGTLPDPQLAALYVQYARYLLIASSRPGTQPANLQGIWNDQLAPPWDSKWTVNINTEMNFWLAEPGNLSELHNSLFQMLEEVSKTGREVAKEHYDSRGWVLHHNTDIWRGAGPINHANHGIWVTGGAWLAQHFWEHYLFTGDDDFLRNRAYPMMKGAATFFIDFLIEDPATGWLISTPSNSPEIGGLVKGPTMDHQIIRSLFEKCIEASTILKTDQAFADSLRAMVSQIAPTQIGKHGQIQEWLTDVDDPENKHRHISHLWAHHPGNEITIEKTPELAAAVRTSLIHRGDEGTGWSLAWKINQWARLKDGGHCEELFKLLFSAAGSGVSYSRGGSYPNLFDAHPPFQIDGNFGAAAGILEMILQSHKDKIELLPALPSLWPSGNLKGVKARGGFELDISWGNHKLTKVKVLSRTGNPLVLNYGDKTIQIATTKAMTYQFDGQLNQTIE